MRQADLLAGPQQAGAGTNYGQISVVDLECRFNPTDLDTLNVNMINAIKFVPGTRLLRLRRPYPAAWLPVTCTFPCGAR